MTNGAKRLTRIKKSAELLKKMSIGSRTPLLIFKTKSNGVPFALIQRRGEQFYRGSFATMSDARKAGVLCWMIDASMIPYLRDTYGVRYIAVLERETGDLWLSTIESWEDEAKLFKSDKISDRTDRHGSALRHLPVQHMLKIPHEQRLIVSGR